MKSVTYITLVSNSGDQVAGTAPPLHPMTNTVSKRLSSFATEKMIEIWVGCRSQPQKEENPK